METKPKHDYDLKAYDTRTLLHYLDKARACGSGYDPTENHGPVITIAELKAELKTVNMFPTPRNARSQGWPS